MRTSTKASLAAIAAALAFSSTAFACGICVEDRVAAVFDNAIVDGSLEKRRHVVFFGVEGALPATEESRRALLQALHGAGVVRGSARVSLESASVAGAYDPSKTTLEALRTRVDRRLAARGLSVTPLRFIDEGGVLKEP